MKSPQNIWSEWVTHVLMRNVSNFLVRLTLCWNARKIFRHYILTVINFSVINNYLFLEIKMNLIAIGFTLISIFATFSLGLVDPYSQANRCHEQKSYKMLGYFCNGLQLDQVPRKMRSSIEVSWNCTQIDPPHAHTSTT